MILNRRRACAASILAIAGIMHFAGQANAQPDFDAIEWRLETGPVAGAFGFEAMHLGLRCAPQGTVLFLTEIGPAVLPAERTFDMQVVVDEVSYTVFGIVSTEVNGALDIYPVLGNVGADDPVIRALIAGNEAQVKTPFGDGIVFPLQGSGRAIRQLYEQCAYPQP